jgi:molybdenum cofactor guanylyltransferase
VRVRRSDPPDPSPRPGRSPRRIDREDPLLNGGPAGDSDHLRRADPEATGIVLAGGRSARFGRDKLAEPYRGLPLLHHAILRVAEVCGDVVLVLAPEVPEPELPVGTTTRVARDAVEGEGPLAGLLAGLLEVSTEWALVAGGDMPELSTAVLLEMLDVAREAPVDAVTLAEEGGYRPLPIALRAGPAREAAHHALHDAERSLRGFLDGLRVAVVDEPTWHALDPQRRTLRDVDTPGDLER